MKLRCVLGHEWSDPTRTDASGDHYCEAPTARTCSRCGKVVQETPGIRHDWIDQPTTDEARCAGRSECTRCGASRPTERHDWTDEEVENVEVEERTLGKWSESDLATEYTRTTTYRKTCRRCSLVERRTEVDSGVVEGWG